MFFVLLAFASAKAFAASWYVATTGSDESSGSIEQPFATVQRAQLAAEPSDAVFILGGTYRMTEALLEQRRGLFARLTVLLYDHNSREVTRCGAVRC